MQHTCGTCASRFVQFLHFVRGKTRSEFLTEQIVQDAVIRQLTVLGEAAARVSETTRQRKPSIPWKRIIGLRNVLVHRYDKVEMHEVWSVAETHVPALLQQIEPLIPPLPEEDSSDA